MNQFFDKDKKEWNKIYFHIPDSNNIQIYSFHEGWLTEVDLHIRKSAYWYDNENINNDNFKGEYEYHMYKNDLITICEENYISRSFLKIDPTIYYINIDRSTYDLVTLKFENVTSKVKMHPIPISSLFWGEGE